MPNESQPAAPRCWEPFPADRKPTITAHAGAEGTEPNSRRSFEEALARGVDYLEADVRFAPDGSAYLSHDELAPAERARAMGLEELLRLVARAGADGTAPRLNLDLKEFSSIDALSELIFGLGMESRVLLTGVRIESVPAVRAGCRGLPYFLNASPGPLERMTRRGAEAFARRIRGCGAVGLNANWRFVTRTVARALAGAGLALSVWTVDDEAGMRRFLGLGADNITTRFPKPLAALRDAAGRGPVKGAA